MWYKLLLCILISGCNLDPNLGAQLALEICRDQDVEDKDKDYVLLATDDNLDSYDINVFDIGLSCLKFKRKIVDIALDAEHFQQYVEDTPYFLYFSGHGSANVGIYADDEQLLFDSSIFNASYVFISACSVLGNADKVKRLMGPNTQTLMGYTRIVTDSTDNWMAYYMIENMHNGDDIPTAFFNAHKDSKFKDRWVIYDRQGEDIIEYSERSENKHYRSLK